MDIELFSYKSKRAHKARIGFSIKPWILLIEIAAAVFFVSGVILIVLGYPIGWAILGLTTVPAMIAEWYRGELQLVPASKDAKTIDDVLESDILAHLPENPLPFDIAVALSLVRSGHFFAARFGISGGFLQQLVSTNPDDSAVIWEQSLNIQKQLGVSTISAGILIVALVRQVAKKESLLGHLQLGENDLLDGVMWYEHIAETAELYANQSKHPGGIGRDWSYGWIPTLSRFGQNISEGLGGSGSKDKRASLIEPLEQLIQNFDGEHGKSMALVGPTGVGKTELIYAFAGKLMDPHSDVSSKLKFHQVFLLRASSLISAAPGRGQLEDLVNNILGEAYSAKNIIVCLDDAQLFFEDGVGSVDLSGVLLPILQAGRLPLILTMDEQKYLQIAKRLPDISNAMNRINIQSASEPETLGVMQDQSMVIEFQNKVAYMYQALKEAYRLSERYVYDLGMPGRALKLLEAASQYAEGGLVSAKSVQLAIEKTMNVKVGVADEDGERDKLLNLETLIHERMIGQTKAVSVVSDALRRARAGVRNQNRPIGTFLFLGPTGVGKTELAKSVAAIYFDSEEQLIRLDMNEFVSAGDVARLIADGANDPNSLTARVMKQPFSVILLDEIEKAHSSVLTTLLQLLDEGILRDVNNREISFRDSIVIATSNAGADRIREYIDRGYSLEQFEDKLVNELIDSNIFHSEFLNRFDDIVVFEPLSKKDLLQVVDLILADVNKTLALQKVSVQVADDAKEYLVEAGYDPRLGARPLRRIVQRTVENMVAKEMLSKTTEAGGAITIGLEAVKDALDKKKTADDIVGESEAK